MATKDNVGGKTFIELLEKRPFEALCENVNVRLHQPNNQKGQQVIDLKLRVRDVTPWDLRENLSLLNGAFHKLNGASGSIEEVAGVSPEAAKFNAGYEPLRGKKLLRSDEDAHSKVLVGKREIYPAHGIALTEVIPGRPAPTATVDLVISVKGVNKAEGGIGWLESGHSIQFAGKNATELEADAAASTKKKVHPGQQKIGDTVAKGKRTVKADEDAFAPAGSSKAAAEKVLGTSAKAKPKRTPAKPAAKGTARKTTASRAQPKPAARAAAKKPAAKSAPKQRTGTGGSV